MPNIGTTAARSIYSSAKLETTTSPSRTLTIHDAPVAAVLADTRSSSLIVHVEWSGVEWNTCVPAILYWQ